ncbi:glutamine synthetase family protein [Kineosporia sp. A_224]|uniref:glutamine synthetase family protein n=1 Tax=Kineosporia sp. A_224 TaxID=1962180 RepID=UPI000B4A5A07|nr:glutamine synthetase family protein [Kineosporia sp. A_224]
MTTYADPVPGGRAGDGDRAQALAGDLAAKGVHGVVMSWVDTCGVNRVKTVPVARLASAARWGVGMSPVFDLFLADDSIVTGDLQGGPDGDLRLVPDLDHVVPLAGQPGWAWAPVDRMRQDGTMHPGCSRTILRRLVGAAREQGIELKASIEIEFALGRGDVPYPAFEPACVGSSYGMTRLVEQTDFCADALEALAAEGVDVDQIHPEYAAGQYEVSVGALDPVGAADRSVLVRQTLRAVAQRHGLRISFSPSVLAAGVGNGGHLHLSAWRDGANLHSTGQGRYGMTAEGEAFAAGVLDALPALAAVTTPSPASYLRLQPSHWAGVYACWGHETRESALRIVTGMVGNTARAANIEVKCADLSANPYLLITGAVAAGLDGIARGLTLPDEISGDPAGLDPVQAEKAGVRRLPTSLAQAVDAFAASPLPTAAFGDLVVDAVLAVRRGEAARAAGLDAEAVAEAYRWVY